MQILLPIMDSPLKARDARKDDTFPVFAPRHKKPADAVAAFFRRMGYLKIDQKSTLSIMYHAVPRKKTIMCMPTRLQHIDVFATSSACSRGPALMKKTKGKTRKAQAEC